MLIDDHIAGYWINFT